ncbi:MAG: flippase, partial [Candidatus Binataceae bacterium]
LIVYLIRPGDGFESFRRFVDSYRRFPEPLDHDLLVIFKGFASRAQRAAYYQALEGLRFLEMGKIDFGQDVGSFHLALTRFAYSHYLFLGAHCQIMAEGYLTKMMNCLKSCPKAALVGPGGAYTSLRVLLSPPFPNYAIRTNAFLAPRDILLKVRWPAVLCKVDAWAFEYGWCSLTRQILDMGLEPYVVTAEGSCFPKERWLESRTFYHTDQANLLIGDKRTDLFRDADPPERLRLALLAWGERGREVYLGKGMSSPPMSGQDPYERTADLPVSAERSSAEIGGVTGGGALVRNIFWNLGGMTLPSLAALFAIPVLIHALGAAKFGALALAWSITGSFNFFDLGLGRALTKLVADKNAVGAQLEIRGLFWTGFFLLVGFGILCGLGLAAISNWLVYHSLRIPPDLQTETVQAFYVLSLVVPLTVATSGLWGTLAGIQRFDLVNLVQGLVRSFSFLGPLALLPFTRNLAVLVCVLAAGRLASWLGTLWLCLRAMPFLRADLRPQRPLVRPLLSFGGWATVSSVIGGIFMMYTDRFLIGVMLSMASVAYFIAPEELITKLWIVPVSIMGVLFPAFAERLATDPSRAVTLFAKGAICTFAAVFPLALIAAAMAREGLTLWLGAPIAARSTVVLQWLAVGVLINCVGSAPFALIQSAHRPDLIAKLHLAEMPLYLFVLWKLIAIAGINGAAIAWTIRAAADTVALLIMAGYVLPATANVIRRLGAMLTVGALVTGAAALMPGGLMLKGPVLVIALALYALALWSLLVPQEYKKRVMATLRPAT